MSKKTVIDSTSRKNAVRRWLYQNFEHRQGLPTNTIMIMGSQRSGTTLFSRVFDDLPFAKVFGEFSELSSDEKYGLRLNSPEKVMDILSATRARLIVMKPLVESQNAIHWLETVPNSIVVWLYRHYADVASSSVKKFGEIEGGVHQARAFVDADFAAMDHATWKSEGASASTVDFIRNYYSDEMSGTDAAALFWYARNRLFFDQCLQTNSSVVLLKYEHFVESPYSCIANILEKVGISSFKSKTISGIGKGSIGKGQNVSIDSGIEVACESLLAELDAAFALTSLGRTKDLT